MTKRRYSPKSLRGLDPWPPKGNAKPSEDCARKVVEHLRLCGWEIRGDAPDLIRVPPDLNPRPEEPVVASMEIPGSRRGRTDEMRIVVKLTGQTMDTRRSYFPFAALVRGSGTRTPASGCMTHTPRQRRMK
jgi:hypothetical protein